MTDNIVPTRDQESRALDSFSACRILLIDASPLRRAALKRLLEDSMPEGGCGFMVSDAVSTLDQAQSKAEIGLVLLSIGGASTDTPEVVGTIQEARRLLHHAPIVVLSDRNETPDVVAAFRAGVLGFITTDTDPSLMFRALRFIIGGGVFFPPEALLNGREKDSEWRLPQAMAAAHENEPGGSALTARQKRVLQLLRQGQSNKRIAIELQMCESTVKVHVRQIMRKLGVANRTQAALFSVDLDLPEAVPLEPIQPQRGEVLPLRTGTRLIPA
jgi:two-component system, NarL family, nitrate/nitrite response regulator NarL